MSIDHRAEAKALLAQAARESISPDGDPMPALGAAQVHAALANNTVNDELRAENNRLRVQLNSTRRWVAGHIAHALVSGDGGRWLAARELAQGLDSADANIDGLVDEHLADDGHDSKKVWGDPYAVTPAEDPWAADPTIAPAAVDAPDVVRMVLAARLAEMLLAPGSDDVRMWARNIAFELKREGVDLTPDIEKRITELTLGRDPSDPPF
jgi:hypothetical protein